MGIPVISRSGRLAEKQNSHIDILTEEPRKTIILVEKFVLAGKITTFLNAARLKLYENRPLGGG
jgi:hypothetical protein